MQTATSFFKAFGAFLIVVPAFQAQGAESSVFGSQAQVAYRVVPNITYLTANNYDLKLDMYQARGQSTPQATVIYIHGGGWIGGSKETNVLNLLPYFETGWNVVLRATTD